MTLRTRWSLLGAVLLVTACATPSRMTPAERLELYRANAGEPVRSFQSPGGLRGWRALGDSALTIWTSSNGAFLLELADSCPEIAFASSLWITNRSGQVAAGFDTVVVRRGGVQANLTVCRIDTIRPVDSRVVKEARRDLHELHLVDRNAAVPGAPR